MKASILLEVSKAFVSIIQPDKYHECNFFTEQMEIHCRFSFFPQRGRCNVDEKDAMYTFLR